MAAQCAPVIGLKKSISTDAVKQIAAEEKWHDTQNQFASCADGKGKNYS
jgi:hypothetical protein